jgi:hypothetical protein
VIGFHDHITVRGGIEISEVRVAAAQRPGKLRLRRDEPAADAETDLLDEVRGSAASGTAPEDKD